MDEVVRESILEGMVFGKFGFDLNREGLFNLIDM